VGAQPGDLDRLMEAVRLSRKIGRTAPFSDLIAHEMAPGNAVDDGEALRTNIVTTVDAGLRHDARFSGLLAKIGLPVRLSAQLR
jgi:hypothetical protein